MTWFVILSIIVVSALKLLITCLPTPVVNWLLKKFELHSKLDPSHISILKDGKTLEGEEKKKIITEFNKATFLKKYYIHPGNEHYFLQPEGAKTPYIIYTKQGKHDIKLSIYSYKDHVDVVKQYKKKLEVYSLLPDKL
ncbi:YfmQ family protein [Priestia megaterium]|uniref:YfmQ family protein n=1 Tax=Priestia megaterium TaxID=1404 RepID=UPI002E1B0FF6|nr:YfmQ family protein [Priestia megaterium]